MRILHECQYLLNNTRNLWNDWGNMINATSPCISCSDHMISIIHLCTLKWRHRQQVKDWYPSQWAWHRTNDLFSAERSLSHLNNLLQVGFHFDSPTEISMMIISPLFESEFAAIIKYKQVCYQHCKGVLMGGSKRIEKLLHLSQLEVNISIKPKQAPPDSHERGGLGPRGAPFDAQARGKKPGNPVKNVDSDWSAGLCEVWGFYWSLVAGSDLKSDPHWPSAPSEIIVQLVWSCSRTSYSICV